MPEGVEHQLSIILLSMTRVMVTLAVMPEGVEHATSSMVRWREVRVTLAVMPEGVEHSLAMYSSEETSSHPRRDAGRR